MITEKELQYVTKPASSAPYPGDSYAYDVINNISYALAIFRRQYEGKTYSLVLSNGEKMTFEIKSWNLPHLLGIDYRTITSQPMKKLLHNVLEISDGYKINSLVLLNRIIENADKVIASDEENLLKILNYYKIMFKTSCFLKFSHLDTLNFGVLNFNRNVYNNISENYHFPMATKYIFSPSDEKLIPFNMMGFKYDDIINVMVPETLIGPNNFSDYLYGQQLLLPLELTIIGDAKEKKIIATNEDKIRILNFYKSLVEEYNTDTYINGLREISKTKIK